MKHPMRCIRCSRIIETASPLLECLCWGCWNTGIAHDMQITQRYRGYTYAQCSFENYDAEFNNHEDKVKTLRVDAEKRNSVFILGTSIGCGKTHLAVAYAKLSWIYTYRINAENYYWLSVREFGSYVSRAGFNFERCIKAVEGIYGVNLILDDLGRSPERAREAIELLIDNSYQKKKQIIITGNVDGEKPDELKQFIDASIIDRILENGVIVPLEGKSYRTKK